MGKIPGHAAGRYSSSWLKGINGRLVLLLFVVLVPLLIIQALTFYDRFQTEKAKELQNNLEMARAVGNTFSNFVKDVVHQELAIGLAVTAAPTLSRAELTRLLEQSAKDRTTVRAFHWVGPDGRILNSSDPGAVGQDLSERPYFKEVKAGRDWSVGDLRRSPATGEPEFDISRGVRDQKGAFLGMVSAIVDPRQLDRVLALERKKDSGISLMDSQGRLVYRFPHLNNLTWEGRQWAEIYPIVKEALQGKEETAIQPTTSFDNKSRLVAVTPIRTIGWIAGAGKRTETAMRGATDSLMLHGGMFFLTGLAACLFAWWLCRTISRPLEEIKRQLPLIGKGELPALADVGGPTEVKEFAGAFNAMLAELLRTSAILQTVSEVTPDCIFVKDDRSRMIYANPAALSAIGQPATEFMGKTEIEWHPDLDQAAAMMAVDREVMQTGATQVVEETHASSGGVRTYLTSKSPLTDAVGKVVGIVGIARDITARKRREEELRQARLGLEKRVQERTAELAATNAALAAEIAERQRAESELQESKERLQLALSGADLGMWDWNIQTGEVVFNSRWAEMLGYTLEEIEPQESFWERLKHPEDRSQVREMIKAHLKGKTPVYESEHRLRHKTGGWIWVLDKGKVTHWDEQGKPLRAVGTHLDITDRKRAEAEGLRMQERLQQVQKSESLNRMAGAIAHNFNNILSAVVGNLELALYDAPQGSEQHSYLNKALQASHRAAEVSRFMLTYVGQTAWKAETNDAAVIAREACTLMRVALSPNVHFRTDLPPSGPMIKGDAAHLTRILTNLMTNAVEAIGEGEGTITVTGRLVAGSMIREAKIFPPDWEAKAENYVCFQVADTGPGMAPKTLNNIFDPFFSTKFVGRGLGLPVALGLVRSYEGAIAVESTVGNGTIFKVFLPVAEMEPLEVAAEEALPMALEVAGRLIMVVDDEPEICSATADVLKRRFGYNVITAGDGLEALKLFGSQKDAFSLVILDLSMPEMNGWQTMEALRALRPDIPVILASGYDEAQVMSYNGTERAQAFLAKPFGLKELRAALIKSQSATSTEEEKVP